MNDRRNVAYKFYSLTFPQMLKLVVLWGVAKAGDEFLEGNQRKVLWFERAERLYGLDIINRNLEDL